MAMEHMSRRHFVKAGLAPAIQLSFAKGAPSDRVNIAVVGLHNRGRDHIREFAKVPNVRIVALCDVDERLFAENVAMVEELTGFRPDTEWDFRRLLERKDLDAVSLATPDYWHALQTIWACQAGKDVYVEKPVSFTIVEGRKMVEAARKYRRIVQAGLQRRSDGMLRAAVRFLHEGGLGRVYRGKAILNKPRGNIGRVQESSIPQGVHWDLFLGPSPYKPFTLNRFHYGWHFFWDTSTTDVGNSGVHELDELRWGMGKREHPVRIHSTGGLYGWEDTDQETPNVQVATFEYADGTLLEIEVNNLPGPDRSMSRNVFYGSKGYLSSSDRYQPKFVQLLPNERWPEVRPSGVNEHATRISFPRWQDLPSPKLEPEPTVSHFQNFIDCVRSRRVEDLYCDIEEGHISTTLCHLANISFRTGRKLVFDPKTERFVNDEEANRYLTRQYREPYVLPDSV